MNFFKYLYCKYFCETQSEVILKDYVKTKFKTNRLNLNELFFLYLSITTLCTKLVSITTPTDNQKHKNGSFDSRLVSFFF